MGKNGRSALNLAMILGGSALFVSGLGNIIGDSKQRMVQETLAGVGQTDPWLELRSQNQDLYYQCLKEIGG